MTFDAVGVFGLTFDFLLKICLSILWTFVVLTNLWMRYQRHNIFLICKILFYSPFKHEMNLFLMIMLAIVKPLNRFWKSLRLWRILEVVVEHCQKEYVASKQNSFDLHFYLENIVGNLNTLYSLFGLHF